MAEQASHQVLIGLRVYSEDGLEMLRKAFGGVRELVAIAAVASIYRVVAEQQHSAQIHDLRAHCAFHGFVTAIRGFTNYAAVDLVERLEQMAAKLTEGAPWHGVQWKLFLYDQEAVMSPRLTLPDPDFHCRAEAILPAAEIAPEAQHPVLRQSLRELARPFLDRPWGEFVAQGKAMLDF